MREKIIIGIDPGTKTGFAVKNLATGEWLEVATIKRWEIPVKVLEYGELYEIFVVFEDATQRDWFGGYERTLYSKFQANKLNPEEKTRYKGLLMGAGNVKGSCTAIQEFLNDAQIPHIAQKPKKGATKIDAALIKRIYPGRTSEHSRDAIMLIQGFNTRNLKLYFKAA